jgi:ornithine cyclodeaminase/alanine dehydrogenase-like protein (mu-crystallin family)
MPAAVGAGLRPEPNLQLRAQARRFKPFAAAAKRTTASTILFVVQLIDANTTRDRLAFPALIDALRDMFVAGCEVPQRHTHRIADAHQAGVTAGTVLLMPAWQPGQRLGIKTVTIFPANGARGKPGLHSVYTLFDAATGEPLAQMDGDQITSRRTAAASALAASYLARADASRLLVVGAGRVAALLAEAYAAVRPIRRVQVWSRTPASARTLADRLAARGFQAEAVTDLRAAAADADVISCATLSTAPLVHGAWLQPGTHVDLIGSFSPEMRETDAACFARSRVYVDTHEALAKSGDVLQAIAEGAFSSERLQGHLADLCRGERRGRDSDREITLFKSVGSALEDLAAAQLVVDDEDG